MLQKFALGLFLLISWGATQEADGAVRIADDGLQIFGGHGYIRDLPLEMWLRNARVLTIHNALAAA